MSKHILVISQYFYPEQFRINDICIEWVKRGYEVTVITGIPNYPKGSFFKGYSFFKKRNEQFKGIKIVRIPIIPRGNNALMLMLNYLSFVVSGFIWKIFTKIKANLVFIFEVSPMTQALPGVWYAKKQKIPCYIYVQDLWPENVEIITGIKNKYIINSIGKMVDYIYARCERIFTTSKSFVESIHQRGVPLNKLEYWPQFAEDFYIPLNKERIEGSKQNETFNIIFAGNLGVAQGLEIIPKTAQILKYKTKKLIKFIIVGDGRFKDQLVKMIEDYEVTDMFFIIPQQPAEKIPKLFAKSDAAFLSLSDNPLFSRTIPAKLQTYMASGLPIIAVVTGETETIINESQCGVNSKPNNPLVLAENIIEMAHLSRTELEKLGLNSYNYYLKHFNKNTLLDKMDFFLMQ